MYSIGVTRPGEAVVIVKQGRIVVGIRPVKSVLFVWPYRCVVAVGSGRCVVALRPMSSVVKELDSCLVVGQGRSMGVLGPVKWLVFPGRASVPRLIRPGTGVPWL